MTENWRKKMACSLALTEPPICMLKLRPAPFSLITFA